MVNGSEVDILMGVNLLTKARELLHHKEKLSRSYLEGHGHQTWALGGKLYTYIVGGMTPDGKWYQKYHMRAQMWTMHKQAC